MLLMRYQKKAKSLWKSCKQIVKEDLEEIQKVTLKIENFI